jgi:hypothetical protein
MEKNPMKNLVITFAAIFIVFMALRPGQRVGGGYQGSHTRRATEARL